MAAQSFLSYDEPLKTKRYHDFSGGMFSDAEAGREDAPALLLNMESRGKRLVPSCTPQTVSFENGFDSGAVTASRYADGIWLFRKGHTLYARKNGAFSVIASLTQDHGEIYDDGFSFYIVDGETILTVDRDLSLSDVPQTVPLCFTGLSRSGAYFTEIAPMNPFCRYIDVLLSDEVGNEQIFPASWAVDPTYARAWHSDGREVYPGYLMLRDDRVIFDGDDAKGCRLRLRLLDDDDENRYSFSSSRSYRALFSDPQCVSAVAADDGTLILLLAKDTAIYGVTLPNGFSTHSPTQLTRLDCLRTVTGLVPFDDGFLIFFEDAVKKLSLQNGADGIAFSVLPFKYDFGSDMPGSIVCLDDKIVFASSKGGVCCIDRFGVSEKIGCRSVSANIESGSYGFFSHTAEEYRNASACSAFGKYYLSVGNLTYIWDYQAKLPSAVQTRRQEETMVWCVSDAVRAQRYLAFSDGKLYYTEKDSHTLSYLDQRCCENASSRMVTPQWDLGTVGAKTLLEYGLRYRASHPIRLSLICDGIPHTDTHTLPSSDHLTMKTIRIPAVRTESLALSLSCEGDFSLDTILFRYFV